jgi:hypothetical protein
MHHAMTCPPQFDESYVWKEYTKKGCPIFHQNGTRVFRRCKKFNGRRELQKIRLYTKLFLQHGYVKEGRSGRITAWSIFIVFKRPADPSI